MKKSLIIGSLFACTPAFAGKVTLSGSSNIGHKVDFMSVDVSIVSECFDTQESVLAATNGAAKKIKEIMKSFVSNVEGSRDQIIASPGLTTRSTKTRYNAESRREEVICQNGWHSSNHITLKVADTNAWPQLQREILSVIDSYQAEEIETQAARINVTLSAPTPQLYPETITKLKRQAEKQALVDATEKFRRLAAQCGLRRSEIEEISSDVSRPLPYANRAADAASELPADFEPEFDLIYVRSAWQVAWSFKDNGEGCDQLSELSMRSENSELSESRR